MNKEQWLNACAARYMEKGVQKEDANMLANVCYDADVNALENCPIEAADEDMACWEND